MFLRALNICSDKNGLPTEIEYLKELVQKNDYDQHTLLRSYQRAKQRHKSKQPNYTDSITFIPTDNSKSKQNLQ